MICRTHSETLDLIKSADLDFLQTDVPVTTSLMTTGKSGNRFEEEKRVMAVVWEHLRPLLQQVRLHNEVKAAGPDTAVQNPVIVPQLLNTAWRRVGGDRGGKWKPTS